MGGGGVRILDPKGFRIFGIFWHPEGFRIFGTQKGFRIFWIFVLPPENVPAYFLFYLSYDGEARVSTPYLQS